MELERLMQEEKVQYEQWKEQLHIKFQEEKLQQEEDMGRALDSKLNEQRTLLQKGFNEKAELMGLEIKQLKKEKENLSGGIFKDYVLPLIDTAKDVLSTILQYKISKSLKIPIIP